MADLRGNSLEDEMREAVRGYRVPPEPPLDEMWARIERAHFVDRSRNASRLRRWIVPAIGMAAGLLVGMGIGRYGMLTQVLNTNARETATTQASSQRESSVPSGISARTAALTGDSYEGGPYEAVATAYFGEAAALLRSLPTDANKAGANARFVSEAGELLATTRLLLDSPAAGDPELRSLLDDLELVLAQIARLRTTRGEIELDLITGALEQSDVIPRLHSAVAMHTGSNN